MTHHNNELSNKEKGLQFAESLCAEKGLRFTPIRRQILELIWDNAPHIKAYEIQKTLADADVKLNPPTIYRTLDFLYSNGLIHRIESLNAYAPCHDFEDYHEGQFVICERCNSVIEIHEDDIVKKLFESIRKIGIEPSSQTIEIRGRCSDGKCLERLEEQGH